MSAQRNDCDDIENRISVRDLIFFSRSMRMWMWCWCALTDCPNGRCVCVCLCVYEWVRPKVIHTSIGTSGGERCSSSFYKKFDGHRSGYSAIADRDAFIIFAHSDRALFAFGPPTNIRAIQFRIRAPIQRQLYVRATTTTTCLKCDVACVVLIEVRRRRISPWTQYFLYWQFERVATLATQKHTQNRLAVSLNKSSASTVSHTTSNFILFHCIWLRLRHRHRSTPASHRSVSA